MIRSYFVIIVIALTAILGANMSYAKDIYGGKSDQELLDEGQKLKMGLYSVMVKYIYTELYVGMPENEFIKLYDESNKSKQGEFYPQIIKHKKNQYYLQLKDAKMRVTFKDGKLIKYERQRREKPPFAFLVYSDETYKLKNHEFFDGILRWMPEEEFLSKCKDKIIDKYREGYYGVKTKNGIYGINFLNGYLEGVYKQN